MNNINLIPLEKYLAQLERRPSGEVITYTIEYNGQECSSFQFKSAQDREKIIQFYIKHNIINVQSRDRTIWGTFPRTVNVDESLARGEWVWDDWV